MPHKSMADDAAAPPALPPREGATPPELPPREAVESLSLEDDVADLDAAAADEGHEEEAADAAEEIAPPPLTEEEEEARGVAQHLLLNAPPGEFTELLDDVASITPERALEGGFVTGVARARNAQILETATTQDGARVVLCRDVKDVAALVEEKENALHAGLEAMYGDMADATFKALRRVMPITKLKMKWSVDALRLKGGLTRAAAEV